MTKNLAGTAFLILTLITLSSCGGGGGGAGSSPTAPSNVPNIAGSWTGTSNNVAATSGTHCVNQLLQGLITRGFSESLSFKVIQFQDLITVQPTVGGKPGGAYEGRLTGSDFSVAYKAQTGALGLPTFCQGNDYFLVEQGGAFVGHISAGILTGSGTRDFKITNPQLVQLGSVTVTYQYSVRQ